MLSSTIFQQTKAHFVPDAAAHTSEQVAKEGN